MTYGVDTNANQLLPSLTTDAVFEIPVIDLSDPIFQIPGGADSDIYKAITKLTNADMTTGSVDGTGTFDVFMQGMKAQLIKEFEKGRITGAEYTKAYIALTQGTMQSAVQYLLGRDQAFWTAVAAQAQSITARVQLETAKVQYATMQLEAYTAKANYALTKAKIATEDMNYGTGKYNLENILPAQLAQAQAQTAGTLAQTVLITKQQALTVEQTEAAHAQTVDTRLDGSTVTGSVGAQKQLYQQQITSYKRNAEVTAAKLFTDAWITQKTLDEGLVPPNGFANASVDSVLTTLKANNQLGV